MGRITIASSRLLESIGALILVGALGAGIPSYALAAQVGDIGSFAFPIHNVSGSTTNIVGLSLSVLQAPSWISVDPELSTLGPIDVPPGQTGTLELVYELLNGFSPGTAAQIDVTITHQDGDTTPSFWVWRISSTDGFQTYSATCQDTDGPCGEVSAAVLNFSA